LGSARLRGIHVIGAAVAALAAPAWAQSSVTIYGIAHVGVVFERGGAKGNVTKVTSGIASGSRLGFRGTEDLGGGQSAYFLLESGFGLNTGANAQGVNVNAPQQGLWVAAYGVYRRPACNDPQPPRRPTSASRPNPSPAWPIRSLWAWPAAHPELHRPACQQRHPQYSTPNWSGPCRARKSGQCSSTRS
jgi:hypothetical protein